MPMTLVEAAKHHSGDVLRQAVIEIFAETSDILRALPFMNIQGNAIKYNQEHTPPGIGFRGINEGYTESTGIINPVTESLVIAGGDIDVDKFMTTTMGEDIRTSQETGKIKALAHKWTERFIKGDTASQPKEMDGLQVRLTGSQKVAQGSTSGGDALSLFMLDTLISRVNRPTHLIMNQTLSIRLTAAARKTDVGGFVTWDVDEFGRRIQRYNGLPILLADNNDDIYPTLAFDEANPGGGSNVGTSIYCVSFGDGMLQGIQKGDPMVDDLGQLQEKPMFRTRVEWYTGICIWHPRAAARLWGIKDAAVVA